MMYFTKVNIYKKCFPVFLVIQLLLICYFIYFVIYREKSIKRFDTKATFTILLWTPYWKIWINHSYYGAHPFKGCKYRDCFITDDRHFLPLEEIDAVIFHSFYDTEIHGVPWIRSPYQVYIYLNLEAPLHTQVNLKKFAYYFNWTMTYRRDSDIVIRRKQVIQKDTNYKTPSTSVIKNKRYLVAWIADNCNSLSHREDLVKRMQKFVPVDIYGVCGTMKCGGHQEDRLECYKFLEKNYKFYLLFENYYCKDYVNEDLYNILGRNIVPVVYGYGDYTFDVPFKSVINVEDFESIEDLTNYLMYLDKDVSAYLEYFEWKKFFKIIEPQDMLCQLCSKAFWNSIPYSIYHDIHGWWWGKNVSVCKTRKELPKIVSDLLIQK